MFGIEIFEDKDPPRQRGHLEYSEKGKTASLLLRLCTPLFATGKVVILDSGFCVLEALLTLKQYGVFAYSLIKKRRYLPTYEPVEQIKAYFQDKTVGDCHRLPGEKDRIKFDLFVYREPDYIMMLMRTYGACIECQDQQESERSWMQENHTVKKARFFYKEVNDKNLKLTKNNFLKKET